MGQAPAGMCAVVSSAARDLSRGVVAHPSFSSMVTLTFVLNPTSSSSPARPSYPATAEGMRGLAVLIQ